jgi:hypothetical protein
MGYTLIEGLHVRMDLDNCWTRMVKVSLYMGIAQLLSSHMKGNHFRELPNK